MNCIGQFAMIPFDIAAGELRPVEKAVYLALATYAPNIFPSIDTLSTVSNVSRITVFRSLKRLKELGLIDWVRTGRSNVYMIKHLPKTAKAFMDRMSQKGKGFLVRAQKKLNRSAYRLKSNLTGRRFSNFQKDTCDVSQTIHKLDERTKKTNSAFAVFKKEEEDYVPMPDLVRNKIKMAFSGKDLARI